MKEIGKKFLVFALALMFVLPFLSVVNVEAAEVNYPGNVFKEPFTTEDRVFNPNNKESELLASKNYMDFELLEASEEVYVIGLSHKSEGNNPVEYRTYLFYSPASFKLKERWRKTNYSVVDGSASDSSSDFYTRVASKDVSSGLYFFEKSSSCSLYLDESIKSMTAVPAYKLTECFYDTGVKEKLLLSISNGTFSDEYEHIEGSDVPDFDLENAGYGGEIGYLQNVTRDIFAIDKTGENDSSFVEDYYYRFNWSKLTDKQFDVSVNDVYVSFYNQVNGYVMPNLPSPFNVEKKREIVGERRFIKLVKGSDLKLEVLNSDISRICSDDVSIFDKYANYTPAWLPVRNDIMWLRVEYKGSDGSWRYGGWIQLKGNAQNSTITTVTPDGDLDIDGGYADGEDLTGNIGIGTDINGAEDNSKPIEGSSDNFSLDDFPDILKSLGKSIGEVPKFLGELFTFIPQTLINAICTGIVVVIIMRILGR